ncbi:Small nuclear ribonucleoprotein-associated protein B [Neophaeococcomyces mojaviensis]|uniref:Small nuclear ribonucleoprotein-associated protein B n=1 Tax=Neophaeococcomyces mojaviensis TaxID=3383035 RepID=A0ACC3A666_9EURO|nr:Small nuclear ribonucleoprotein-associated protein B [Knufia sp. JES_112]
MANKQGKMQNLINYRMRITLNDGRQMTGQMLAFDKHMNLVVADTEEFRKVRSRAKSGAPPAPGSAAAAVTEQEEKRTLGLVILRGTNIVSCSVEGPPPSDPSARLGASAPGGAPVTLQAGQGISRPAGRGLPVGLGGPVAGIGGPPAGGFGFPPAGVPPPGFGRGAPPGGLPAGFPGQAPPFQPPPGFGRGNPPPGFGGR